MAHPFLVNSPFSDQTSALILKSHSRDVNSVEFSPSGLLLASGSFDNTIRLWNAESWAEVATLKGHSNQIEAIAFSPDGSKIASASFDKTVRLWDVESKAQISILKGHEGSVYAVAFSPDGAGVVSGSGDKTVQLWDVKSGKRTRVLRGHSNEVRAVATSPNSQRIASGANDKTTRLWDVASGTTFATLGGHSSWVTSLAYSPNGEYLASGSVDSNIRIWDAATGSHTALIKGHPERVTSLVFSPHGKYLASGSYDNTIRIWDVATSQFSTFKGHSLRVNSVAFSPDGRHLASGSTDHTIRIWNTPWEQAADTRVTMFTSDMAVAYNQEDAVPPPPALISVPTNSDITGSVTLGSNMLIGHGGFGDLFLGHHKDYGMVALKKPHKLVGEALIRRFLREVEIWRSISHPNILPCLGVCWVGLDVYVVSPFIPKGDLHACMARGTVLNHNKLLFEAAEALTHLHHRGIIHGDVKAQNILLSNDGSALLCDFGLAKMFDTMTSTESKGAGSVRWMAPELFLGESRSMASDVYSLGITIAEVLSGRAPFHDILENVAVMFHIVYHDGRPPKQPLHSLEGESYVTLWETAEKCWVKDYKARPSMAQVLAMLFPLTQEAAWTIRRISEG